MMLSSTLEILKECLPMDARLQAPYLVWLAFAAYLNAGFWLLNR